MAAAVSSANEYERLRSERIAKNQALLKGLEVQSLKRQLEESVTAGVGSSSGNAGAERQQRRRRIGGSGANEAPATPRDSSRRSNRLEGRASRYYGPEILDDLEKRSTRGRRQTKGRRLGPSSSGGKGEEVYDEEDEKKLGAYEEEWELFVDGVVDGKKVYDQVRGKTCHQCRQKTLGLRTQCSQCESLRGQFCGDCLFMRYGENVREALAKEEWVCPVCRDICNCSFCRIKKGWPPTGQLYRAACNEGFKSVAHYLMATRRKPTATSGEASKPTTSGTTAEEASKPKSTGSTAEGEAKEETTAEGSGESGEGVKLEDLGLDDHDCDELITGMEVEGDGEEEEEGIEEVNKVEAEDKSVRPVEGEGVGKEEEEIEVVEEAEVEAREGVDLEEGTADMEEVLQESGSCLEEMKESGSCLERMKSNAPGCLLDGFVTGSQEYTIPNENGDGRKSLVDCMKKLIYDPIEERGVELEDGNRGVSPGVPGAGLDQENKALKRNDSGDPRKVVGIACDDDSDIEEIAYSVAKVLPSVKAAHARKPKTTVAPQVAATKRELRSRNNLMVPVYTSTRQRKSARLQ